MKEKLLAVKYSKFLLLIILIILGINGCVSDRSSSVEHLDLTDETVLLPTHPPLATDQPQSTSTPTPDILISLTSESVTLLPNQQPETPTPTPNVYSSFIEGWLLYRSNFYHYEISYPPKATLTTVGILSGSYEPEEKPSHLTNSEYLTYLRLTYPDPPCVGVYYQSGFVFILAPLDKGGKYVLPCPGLGFGAPTSKEITGEVTIGSKTYVASGFAFYENDEAAIWGGEFLSFQMEDGTVITFGGVSDGETNFEEYLAIKEVLLEILSSYQTQ